MNITPGIKTTTHEINGTYPLLITIEYNGKKKTINTYRRITVKQFKALQKELNATTEKNANCSDMCRYFLLEAAELHHAEAMLSRTGKECTITDIILMYNNKRMPYLLKPLIEQMVEEKRKTGNEHEAKFYDRMLKHIMQHRGQKEVIDIREINVAWLNNLEGYFKQQQVPENLMSAYFRTMHLIYKKAAKAGLCSAFFNPFTRKEIYNIPQIGYELTQEELERLTNAEFHNAPSLCLARDMFLFGHYTKQMLFFDIIILKKESLCNKKIWYNRCLDKRVTYVTLNPDAANIINKYDSKGEMLFPIISPHLQNKTDVHVIQLRKYNTQLKKIARILGLTTIKINGLNGNKEV